MNESLADVLTYFSRFAYAPTHDEIVRYFPRRGSREAILTYIREAGERGEAVVSHGRVAWSRDHVRISRNHARISRHMLRRFGRYLPLIRSIRSIELIGVSGSCAMHDAGDEDDIDIFLIVKPQTAWMTRFLVLILVRFMGALGIPEAKKFCLNMIFESHELALYPGKQTRYVAHEIAQLHVLYDRTGRMHDQLIASNLWMRRYLPNIAYPDGKNRPPLSRISSRGVTSVLLLSTGRILRWIQYTHLRRKGFQVHERAGQLWLLQQDWERSI